MKGRETSALHLQSCVVASGISRAGRGRICGLGSLPSALRCRRSVGSRCVRVRESEHVSSPSLEVQSLDWETFEQYCAWQLFLAHNIPLETIIPILQHLKYKGEQAGAHRLPNGPPPTPAPRRALQEGGLPASRLLRGPSEPGAGAVHGRVWGSARPSPWQSVGVPGSLPGASASERPLPFPAEHPEALSCLLLQLRREK